MWQLLFLLLPLAATCGWYVGHKQRHPASILPESNKIPDDYFLGLNYLINEQPDKAVDAFIKVLTVDTDTVEMHLSLGNLFRRKGEVNRAIRIHQNLIARPQLTKEQRSNAIFELAQDYLCAGVLDRAEKLFLELVEIDKENEVNYKFLLSLYEKQKDWRQAITMTQKLAVFSKRKLWTPIAYYYCELAEETNDQGLAEETEIYLKRALAEDKSCVRASIMLGELAAKTGHYKTAIYFYKQVKKQDPDFLSVVVSPLAQCYEILGKKEELLTFLQTSLQEVPSTSLALLLAQYIEKYQGVKAAIDFISQQSSQNIPQGSLRILEYLLNLYAMHTATNLEFKGNLDLAQQLLTRFLKNKPYYRCTNCGFGTKQLYWQCPSCKRWATSKPIKKFEID